MDFIALAHSLWQAAATAQIDESSLSVLAMLAGIISGWTITARQQPKAKKIRAARKPDGESR